MAQTTVYQRHRQKTQATALIAGLSPQNHRISRKGQQYLFDHRNIAIAVVYWKYSLVIFGIFEAGKSLKRKSKKIFVLVQNTSIYEVLKRTQLSMLRITVAKFFSKQNSGSSQEPNSITMKCLEEQHEIVINNQLRDSLQFIDKNTGSCSKKIWLNNSEVFSMITI